MNDENLVEAMARAIWLSSSGGEWSWESLDTFTREGLKRDATAALNAYRNATADDGK